MFGLAKSIAINGININILDARITVVTLKLFEYIYTVKIYDLSMKIGGKFG